MTESLYVERAVVAQATKAPTKIDASRAIERILRDRLCYDLDISDIPGK
jgi:hypothetical protein